MHTHWSHLLLMAASIGMPLRTSAGPCRDGICSRSALVLREADPGIPIPFPKPVPRPPLVPKPVIPEVPRPLPRPQCKRSGCPSGNVSPSNPPPAPPNPALVGDNAIPAHVGRPATGQDIHNNVRGAIARNEPEIIRPTYTQSYKRDTDRANEPAVEMSLSDSRVKNMWVEQGFRVRDTVWKPAVMDTKEFNFRYNRPDTPDSGSTTGSGSYRYGEPMVENYHDVGQGSIMTKSQLKPEADDAGMPFSEKSYQMAKEDFGDNIGNVNRLGVSDIINTGWLQKADTHLAGTPDLTWTKFDRGTPGYNDFLATDNGKWIGYMFADHHGPLNNKDIVAISAARERLPDGTYKGYMSVETGPPQ